MLTRSQDLPYFMTWSAQETAPRFAIESAESTAWITPDKRRVIDLISTNFHAAFGAHCEGIRSRIVDQLNQFPVASPKATFPLKDRASHRLIDTLRAGPGKVFYTVSGSEAVENALKIARHVQAGRRMIAARRESYHGASLGALSITGDWRGEAPVSLRHETIFVPDPREDPYFERGCQALESAGPQNVAAFCLEPISGWNGVVAPPPSWWQAIDEIRNKHKILVILDEVTTGFGRTGPDFALQQVPLQPDMVCLGKAISGGYIPMGALFVSEPLARYYDQSTMSCGLTQYANPLGLAALDAVLDLLQDQTLRAHRQCLAQVLTDELETFKTQDLGSQAISGLRIEGLLAAIDLKLPAPRLWSRSMEAGLLVGAKDAGVILAPPYVMTLDDLTLALGRLREVLHQ